MLYSVKRSVVRKVHIENYMYQEVREKMASVPGRSLGVVYSLTATMMTFDEFLTRSDKGAVVEEGVDGCDFKVNTLPYAVAV